MFPFIIEEGGDELNPYQTKILNAYQAHQPHRPFIVGVDGLSGAGKTTFMSELTRLPDLVILHIDDYIVERSKRYGTGHPEAMEYYEMQWDVAGLVSGLFQPLYEGESQLVLPKYAKEQDVITKQLVDVSKQSIVVIEGIFLQRPEWRAYFDYMMYLDCPREVRYERVLQRDTYIGDMEERLDKYRRRYWPGEEYYEKVTCPKRNANLIIDVEEIIK